MVLPGIEWVGCRLSQQGDGSSRPNPQMEKLKSISHFRVRTGPLSRPLTRSRGPAEATSPKPLKISPTVEIGIGELKTCEDAFGIGGGFLVAGAGSFLLIL